MKNTTRHSRQKPLPGLCAALLALSATACFGDESKSTNENNAISPAGMPTVIADPVNRSYKPWFVRELGKLEAADAGDLPEAKPGKVEVTLPTDRGDAQYRVTLNTSQQVFSLSVPEKEDYSDTALAGSMATAGVANKFNSASMLAFKAKQFDDGLYGAVELATDQGAGKLGSRRTLLADLATALTLVKGTAGSDQALGLLSAATKLGGHAVEVPPAAATVAITLEKEFLADPLRSKPIGFYTWSRELADIFQRDRLLQTTLKPATAKAFAGALGNNAGLLARYRAALRLPERLTNGFARESLAGAAAEVADGKEPALENLALFPPSRAYETDLVRKLYGNTPIPDGFDLADEMVRRIQSGGLKLQPHEDSGWYDHQTYALEPLVIPDQMPEAKHLRLDGSYKKELVKLFKSLLALTRETHAKQLEEPVMMAGGPPGIRFTLRPQLTQEPLASFYLRRALAYRFVRGVLVESFGDGGLAGMKRLTAAGPINLTLDRELRVMESLFYGAYLSTASELGMPREKQTDLGLGEARSLALYRSWKPKEDPDVSRDMRMMVPVFYDVARRMTKVWVVLGVTSRPLNVSYSSPPVLESVADKQGNPVDLANAKLEFEHAEYDVAYPVMAEIYVTKILDRQEMRKLCDKHKTQQAILEHLK